MMTQISSDDLPCISSGDGGDGEGGEGGGDELYTHEPLPLPPAQVQQAEYWLRQPLSEDASPTKLELQKLPQQHVHRPASAIGASNAKKRRSASVVQRQAMRGGAPRRGLWVA